MSLIYNEDEFGVRNYKTRFLTVIVVAVIYLIIALAASALVYFESQNPQANITNYGQAFWVLIMASSTIGFGDFYPTTIGGYVVVTLMFYVGVGMMGYIGALIASKIMGFSDTNVKNRELRHQNAEILKLVKQLNAKVDQLK